MWFSSLLRNAKQSGLGQRRRIPAAPRHRSTFRPRLEALEDRWMPSTLTVLNNLDSGPGSLRAEIAAAQSGDTIAFAPNLNYQTINVTSGELVINKNLTIQGPGAGYLTISAIVPLAGGSDSRLFEVDGASTTVSLSGLTISNGIAVAFGGVANANDGEGGAILNFGTLTIISCTLSNNSAGPLVRFGRGGAIYNAGALAVNNCNLSSNSAGITSNLLGVTIDGDGGAIYNAGTLTVSNSRLGFNTAYAYFSYSNDGGFGGAIYSGYGTTATITGCWLGNNTAVYGGAIYNDGTMTLTGCFLWGNYAYYQGGGIYNDRSGFIRIWSTTFNNYPDNIYNNGGHVQFKN